MGVGTNYGNTAGPGPSYFRAYIVINISAQTDTYYTLRYYYGMQVTTGNFQGTHFNSSWGSSGQAYGTGNYFESSWINAGNYKSGQTLSVSGWVQTRSTTYKSNVSASYTVPQLQGAPDDPTNLNWMVFSKVIDPSAEDFDPFVQLVPEDRLVGTWNVTNVANRPIDNISVNLYRNDKLIAETDTLPLPIDYTDALEGWDDVLINDSAFKYTVCCENSTGKSNITESPIFYSSPSPPTLSGIKIKDTYHLRALNQPDIVQGYLWQVSSDDGATWTEIPGNLAQNDFISEQDELKFRCYAQNKGGMYSLPSIILPKKTFNIYFNIPDNATAKGIYVNVPEGSTPKGIYIDI